jgi:acrylyl-CoA reductase (NADPH)
VNYKDGGALLRPADAFIPRVCGIDLAGTVVASEDPPVQPCDRVLVNGWGMGVTHFGGYAQPARVRSEWTVAVPATLSPGQVMALGTAGYTSMLAVLALEDGSITPDRGSVLVTGASGGLGSIAVLVLADLGSSRRPGARRTVVAHTGHGGIVAVCGLVQGNGITCSTLPFVLRGFRLQGIESDTAPRELRLRAWDRLARDMDLAKLDALSFDVLVRLLLSLATSWPAACVAVP